MIQFNLIKARFLYIYMMIAVYTNSRYFPVVKNIAIKGPTLLCAGPLSKTNLFTLQHFFLFF